MDKVSFGDQRITEALEMLDRAALEKKEELKKIISDRYVNMQELFNEGAVGAREVLSRTRQNVKESVMKGREKAGEWARLADNRVRQKPWVFIGGIAAVAFLAGYASRAARGRRNGDITRF
jgi:ElaB/YqjD/DUF883 family membrane-anchored ribosome-binding protein